MKLAAISRASAVLLVIGAGLYLLSADRFDGARAGDERIVEGIKLCWAPPGHFRMGSPIDELGRHDDEAQVDVTLSRGFWIGKFEVTQGQWKTVSGAFPREMDKGQGDDFPVYWVSYLDAENYCRILTERSHAARELPETWEFRLPTEAQWEYAARAGTTGATAFGDRLSSRQANFNGAAYNGGEPGPSLKQAAKVGSYPANPWGLHDVTGNVWEWCRDWYHWNLPGGVDPDNSARKGQMNRDGTYSRVRRGGAWIEDGWACRTAFRLRYEPERRSDHIGFRVVAEPRLHP